MNLGVKSWPGSAAHSSVTGSWEVNSRASGIKEKEQNRWLGRLNQASLLKSTISNILFPWENEINSAEISQRDEVNKVVLHKGDTASQECYRPSTWQPGDWQPWPCMVIRVPFSGSETIAPPRVLTRPFLTLSSIFLVLERKYGAYPYIWASGQGKSWISPALNTYCLPMSSSMSSFSTL